MDRFAIHHKDSARSIIIHDIRLPISLLYHLMRTDIKLPRILNYGKQSISREALKKLLAEKSFHYMIPALSKLHPEQVLEVRRKVSDLREGFSLHLQTLTADIDTQLNGGESAEEITRYAQNVVKTKLEPQYLEFKRQLGAIHASMGRNVLSAGGSFYVAGNLFTQAQYVEAFIAFLCGGALVIPEMLKDSLSNERQAYQFMHLVENAIDK